MKHDTLVVELRTDIDAELLEQLKEEVRVEMLTHRGEIIQLGDGDPFEGQTFTQAEADRLIALIQSRVR